MIIETGKIEFSLRTQNPFVATMYHVDHYPAGDGKLGPVIKKQYNYDGDFGTKADWHMYYGENVPGFPAHPHRGLETVTVVLQGTIDHTDGLGSMGRYGDGDVQWMTAGKGLQHAEMFPLLKTDEENTLELFQIWLSLDSEHRIADPAYKMLWREDIPVVTVTDHLGLKTKITVIAGEVNGEIAPEPTPDSWAKDKNHRLSIQLIELDPGASYKIPAAFGTMNRSVYFYNGEALSVEDQLFSHHSFAFVTAENETILKNEGSTAAKVLLLESEPIPEPIVAHGPFVMTTNDEIKQAYKDYKETKFGGWPFSTPEIYHDADQVRFAKHADGSVEYPNKKETKI
jgi:redox-sensitive bicupin YhaK (pirin superfamily)